MTYALHHLPAYLAGSAARHPDRPAIVAPDGRAISYADLDDAAARIAGFLAERGIGRGDRVGVMMPKSIETVTAIFGTMQAGAAYVPIDPTAPVTRGRTIAADSEVAALFVDETVAHILDDWDPPSRPTTVVFNGSGAAPHGCVHWDHAAGSQPAPPHRTSSTDDLAYLLYTSGSTGVPKGVQISHANASSFVEWGFETFSPTPADRFSSHAPFHFDLSIFDLYVAIKAGASVHLIADELSKNPRQLAQFVADRDITVWYSTPSALSLLAQFGRLERIDYDGPRVALFAGEVFPIKHLRRIVELWPEPQWYNLYGPTETNVCTFARIPLPIPEDRLDPFPIGVVCSHCDALVLDEEANPVQDGEEGLLLVAGDSVFQGYRNRPGENAAAFREIEGRRWYNTGDVVRLNEEGQYDFLGRRDRMVKRRGYRIELGEIETGLYRHPSLREVGVVALSGDAGVDITACYSSDGPPPRSWS